MNRHSRLTLSWSGLVVAAVALLAVGAAATWLVMRTSDNPGETAPAPASADHGQHVPGGSPPPAAAGMPQPAPGERAPLPDVTITLGDEAMSRAGIVSSPVVAGQTVSQLRLPGVIEPNAYRQVNVTPLVAGRVTRISAALGDRVRRGQTLAEVYSPELADAQTQYLTFTADLEAVHQQLRRTERLADIGAASRQELERIRAEHVAHTAHVENARSRLVLFGMTPDQITRLTSTTEVTATVHVPAPIDGIVTERTANAGLNVDAAARLFTVVDLSTVWVVADLYERDFARVHVGNAATITTTAYPDVTLRGRVSYIDPQLNPDTRTSKVRVEVGNPGGRLRLGMYADVLLGATDGARVGLVPRQAIQHVADRQVVYLVHPQARGQFIEREVRIGRAIGDQVEVLAGVRVGDAVVSEGSFFLRAERERLGLRQARPAAGSTAARPSPRPPGGDPILRARAPHPPVLHRRMPVLRQARRRAPS